MIRRFLPVLLVLACLVPGLAVAQGTTTGGPTLPDTLQNLASKGAQIRYLGREKGLDGWIAVHQGQEQYFYATPDREAVLMGLLFDKTGKIITIRQVQNLQQGNDPTLESLMVESPAPTAEDPLAVLRDQFTAQKDKQSPAESMFAAIENSNWVAIGSDKAPVVYAFIDPQCPHCHDFLKDVRKDFIDAGQLQLRIVPIGFREDTKAQAAVLIAAKDPKDVLYRHLDGDQTALPISHDVNVQAAEMNLSMMQEWKLDATPIIVYRSGKGEIKLVRGRPRNPSDILTDLQP